MAAGPQRRATPAPHLNAHLAPLERALHERARVLMAAAEEGPGDDSHDPAADEFQAAVFAVVAVEFKALARELHHW